MAKKVAKKGKKKVAKGQSASGQSAKEKMTEKPAEKKPRVFVAAKDERRPKDLIKMLKAGTVLHAKSSKGRVATFRRIGDTSAESKEVTYEVITMYKDPKREPHRSVYDATTKDGFHDMWCHIFRWRKTCMFEEGEPPEVVAEEEEPDEEEGSAEE